MNTESYEDLLACLLMEHWVVFTKEWSHITNHLIIQSFEKVTEMQRAIQTVDVQMFEVIQVMFDLFKLFPVVIDQEENPDHGEWDTGVM